MYEEKQLLVGNKQWQRLQQSQPATQYNSLRVTCSESFVSTLNVEITEVLLWSHTWKELVPKSSIFWTTITHKQFVLSMYNWNVWDNLWKIPDGRHHTGPLLTIHYQVPSTHCIASTDVQCVWTVQTHGDTHTHTNSGYFSDVTTLQSQHNIKHNDKLTYGFSYITRDYSTHWRH